MTSQEKTCQGQQDDDLARLCLTQLKCEEALVGSMLDTLAAIHKALLACDWQGLRALLTVQDELVQEQQATGQDRQLLRCRLAPALGISPTDVSYRKVIPLLPPADRAEFRRACDRLTDLVREANRIRHANAALLHYALGFHVKLMEALVGPEATERYGPAGKRQQGGRRSLILGRG